MILRFIRLAFLKIFKKPSLVKLIFRPREMVIKIRILYQTCKSTSEYAKHYNFSNWIKLLTFFISHTNLVLLSKIRRQGLSHCLNEFVKLALGKKNLRMVVMNINALYKSNSQKKCVVQDTQILVEDSQVLVEDSQVLVQDFQNINFGGHETGTTDTMTVFSKLSAKTTITVVTPVYNPNPNFLKALCDSFNEQILDRSKFEIIFVDDGSVVPASSLISEYMQNDVFYKVVRLEQNSGISKSQNKGIEAANNEVIAFVDHDDYLPPAALAWMSTYASQWPSAKIFYTDENIIDERNNVISSWDKSGFNRIQSLFHNNLHHLFGVRRDVFDRIGNFNPDFDFCQDFDFNSRCLFAFDDAEFCHIPHLCYSWRQHSESTALTGTQKPIVKDKLSVLVESNALAIGLEASMFQPNAAISRGWSLYQPVWNKKTTPGIVCSIIIPTRNNTLEIKKCLSSILRSKDNTIGEIIVIDDHSDCPSVELFYSSIINNNLQGNIDFSNVTIKLVSDVRKRSDFNFSRLINFGISVASFETIVLCNNDVLVPEGNWAANLSYLLNKCSIGIVGAVLVNKDEIEHSGVVVGANNGLAANQDAGRSVLEIQNSIQLNTVREVSAVTGALMAFPKNLHERLGGFDEDNLAVEFNDVDFCLRARKISQRIVVNPVVTARHATSTSRKSRPPNITEHIFYLERHFTLRDPFTPPRFVFNGIGAPIKGALVTENFFAEFVRVNIFVHELSLTGAPIFILELIRGIKKWGFKIFVFALCDGPLRSQFEEVVDSLFVSQHNITPYVSEFSSYLDFVDHSQLLKDDHGRLPTIFVFNTVVVLPVAAVLSKKLGSSFPSILYVHEDFNFLDHMNLFLDQKIRTLVSEYIEEETFIATFQSASTLRKYFGVFRKATLTRIRGSVHVKETCYEDNTKTRRKLGVPENSFVISVIGTISERKNQLTLVRELARELEKIPENAIFVFYGANQSSYCQEVQEFVIKSGLSNILIVNEDRYPEKIFGITDLLISVSLNESYPRVILEAAARGIPVLAADCPGVRELVNHDYNGWLLDYDEGVGMVDAMNRIIKTKDVVSNMALIGRRDILRFNNSSMLENCHATVWVQAATF
jgi:glycosyltransferase involved in cell wall biosynthesis